MSKGAKIVCNIIYYVAAFLIGLFLAVALPSIMIYNDSLAEVRNSLESGNYNQAMMHIGGYFDSEYIYLDTTSDNADVVIFNALTLVYNSGEEDDETKDETKVHKAYCGYLFNMRKDYQTAGKLETNQAALLIYDKDNVSHKYQLLDYDSIMMEKLIQLLLKAVMISYFLKYLTKKPQLLANWNLLVKMVAFIKL